MNPKLPQLLPALTLALALGGCSLMRSPHHESNANDNMHRAEATQPTGDEPVNCAPDRIGAAAGQGSNCRHGTGGAVSTPPDSSSSNEHNTPTTPPR